MVRIRQSYGKINHAEKREIMYWNNSRSPQMGGQPRHNMNFGNGGCSAQRSYSNRENSCASQRESSCCASQQESGSREAQMEISCGAVQREDAGCRERQEKERGCARQEESRSGMQQEDGCVTKTEPDCDCVPSRQDPLEGMPLAMAYVPWQDYKDICSEEESWCKGTIFAQLDLEFMARRCN